MKNIKMKPPVPLFNLLKKCSIILYLFLKAKSQAKNCIIKTVVLFTQEEACKENCQEENRYEFFRINLFYFLFEFQNGLAWLLLFAVCSLFMVC